MFFYDSWKNKPSCYVKGDTGNTTNMTYIYLIPSFWFVLLYFPAKRSHVALSSITRVSTCTVSSSTLFTVWDSSVGVNVWNILIVYYCVYYSCTLDVFAVWAAVNSRRERGETGIVASSSRPRHMSDSAAPLQVSLEWNCDDKIIKSDSAADAVLLYSVSNEREPRWDDNDDPSQCPTSKCLFVP